MNKHIINKIKLLLMIEYEITNIDFLPDGNGRVNTYLHGLESRLNECLQSQA